MKWMVVIFGTTELVAGNFVWQAITGPNWEVAFEQSFFQVIAVITIMSMNALAIYAAGDQ